MKITLLDVQPEKGKLNRDFAGGFGTGYLVGNTLFSKLLQAMRSKTEFLPFMPFGYLASILMENGHEVEYRINEIPDADMVIIASSLICCKDEVSYIKKIKKETDSKVGVIGSLASINPSIYRDADFTVIGEPEQAFIGIEDKVPNGEVISEEIADLDTLPFPNWEPFPVGKYSYFPVLKKKPILFLATSRGCPYSCNYCPYMVFGRYRARKVEKVVDEMELLISRHGVKGFVFRDPVFSLKKERTRELAREIIKRGISADLVCETRLDKLDEKTLELLHKAGLKAVEVGIESVNTGILKKALRKPIEIKHQEAIVKFCREIGINVIAFYILGFLNDNEETVLETIEYARQLDTFAAQFTIFTPYPGTSLYESMKDKIDEDFDKFDAFTPVMKHDYLSKEKLLELKRLAYKKYYFRMSYMLRFLKWYLGGRY